MTTLQWAFLLLGAAIAIALVASSLWDKWQKNRPAAPPPPRMTGRDWEPVHGSQAPVEPRQSFDELGVGKPRRRAPEMGVAEPAASTSARAAPTVAPSPAAPPAPASAPPQLFGLYIAEHEGTMILGPKIHAALGAQGLRFGHKKIYHRYEGDAVQFSVASLTKPGSLDPAEAEGFATPGLSVFMVLPGPARPAEALQGMLATAKVLAKALNAELYDSEQRAPLTPDRERALAAQVEEWARRSAGTRNGA